MAEMFTGSGIWQFSQGKRCLPFLEKFIGTGFEGLKVKEILVSFVFLGSLSRRCL